MISRKMQEKLNEQLRREYHSSYLYLAMASYCRTLGLDGAAHWMRVQSREELEHAMKFFDYVEHQQSQPILAAIEQPPASFESVAQVFEKTVEHEKYVTRSINELYGAAVEEKDYATQAFLQWFVSEQIEEEAEAQRILDRIRMIGDSRGSLLYLDKELGKRQAK